MTIESPRVLMLSANVVASAVAIASIRSFLRRSVRCDAPGFVLGRGCRAMRLAAIRRLSTDPIEFDGGPAADQAPRRGAASASRPSALAFGRGRPSARVLSWPSRPLGRGVGQGDDPLDRGQGQADHPADQGLAAGQLGDVLDLRRADHDAVDGAALDLGLLELLDLGRRSPWPARPRRRRPRRPRSGPPGTATGRRCPCRRRPAGPACSSAPGS